MGRFTIEHKIFEDETVLSENYIPDEIKERDEELEQFNIAFGSAMTGAGADNVIVYGGVGVGKTMTTKAILDELQEDAADAGIELAVFFENVKGLSSYQASIELVNSLIDDEDDNMSKQGHSQGTVYDRLWDEIENLDVDQVIFALDEADSFGNDDDLIYQIPRARSNGKITNTELSLVCISNDLQFRENLSSRARSTLQPEEIQFTSYDALELRNILESRVDKAFVDGVFSEATIAITGSIAAQDTGSARTAIQLTRTAGKLARQKDDEVVTEEHIREARQRMEKNTIKNEMASLAQQRKLTLYAIARLAQKDETPAPLKQVHNEYEIICDKYDKYKLARRTVHEKINDLQQVGIVETHDRNTGKDGGRMYRYDLTVSTNNVVEVLIDDGYDLPVKND